jgi:hypothetical protein
MSDKIELPKPKMVVKLVFTDNQNIEAKTDRYTHDELIEILDRCGAGAGELPVVFWGADENDHPVYVSINQPKKLISYLVLDFESYLKTAQRAQFMASQRPPLVRS